MFIAVCSNKCKSLIFSEYVVVVDIFYLQHIISYRKYVIK